MVITSQLNKEVLAQSWMSLYLEMYFNDTPLATATGFTVSHQNKVFLITNRHVVRGRDNITDECLDKKTCAIPNKLKITFNKKPTTEGQYGEWMHGEMDLYLDPENKQTHIWLEHPTLKTQIDVVAIELPTPATEIDYCPYDLQSNFDISLHPSDYLSVVGFPFSKRAYGYLAIWSTGFVASDLDLDFEGLPIFLIDCRTRTGQSGSPVIAHRNGGIFINNEGRSCVLSGIQSKLLGVYSGRVNHESDLGFVWKLSAIQEILSQKL
jgi:hypothetical protein